MNRKVFLILIGIIFGLPLIFAGVFISKLGANMKESAEFVRNAIPLISQPWDASAAEGLMGQSRTIDAPALAKAINTASKKYGRVKSYKIGGASPSTTNLNGESVVTFSYNAYAQCDKGQAVIGVESVREGETWRLRNLNIRDAAPYETKQFLSQ